MPMASPPCVPQSSQEWAAMRDGWMKALREKVFRGWPSEREAGPLDIDRVFSAEADGIRLTAYDFNSQPHVRLRLFLVCPAAQADPESVSALTVLDESGWTQWLAGMRGQVRGSPGRLRPADADPDGFAEHSRRCSMSTEAVRLRLPARGRTGCLDRRREEADADSTAFHAARTDARRHAGVGRSPDDPGAGADR